MMTPMWKLGCTGEFGCNCPAIRRGAETRMKNLRGHGTRAKYQKGCRCPSCIKANRKYMSEYRRARKNRGTV